MLGFFVNRISDSIFVKTKLSLDKDQQISDLLARVDKLAERVSILSEQVSTLTAENADLKERLSRYENPKNSRNSSIPPSKDENRPLKTKSLRKKSNKKPGGQSGHKGNTLQMTENPDHIIDHIPCYCGKCGTDLSDLPYEQVGQRQVVDIPPIQPEYTEHRIYRKQCTCGHTTCGTYPAEALSRISYGPVVESLVGYMHTRQYLPFLRMKELFNDVLNLSVSEGGLHGIIDRLTKRAIPAYEKLRDQIAKSKVVGADETGAKVDGKKIWMWTWQNPTLTFIVASPNRGFATIEENFPKGFPNSILVSDCWKSHFKSGAWQHQICMAHLLRELNYFHDRYKSPWAKKCKKILVHALKIKAQMEPGDYLNHHPPRSSVESDMNALLAEATDAKHKEVATFKKRLTKYRDHLFTFLYHPEVPPDNNGSERAIRNVKVKQKISGQFKSMEGADRFAILRSVIDTAIKNRQNVLNSLRCLAIQVGAD